jgi:hypothetical protein
MLPGISLDVLTAKLRTLDALLTRDPGAADGAPPVAATVVGKAPDGRVVVAVGDRTLALPYDGEAAPGEVIRVPARLLAAAQAAAAAPAEQDTQATAGPTPHLTPAARALATLPPPRAPIVRSEAALGPAAAPAQHVAQALQAALDTSGLFYESHVADWVQGERPASALAQEPQMRWARADAPGTHPQPTQIDAMTRAAPSAPPPAQAADRTAAEATPTIDAPRVAPLHAAAPTPIPLAPEARELVAQQLALHDAPRIAWTGEAWPGQPAHITIADETAHGVAPDAPRAWRVTLATELPQLGRIEAEIRLTGTQASVSLRAAEKFSAARLAGGAAEFRDALAAAGVPLAALTVTDRAPSTSTVEATRRG